MQNYSFDEKVERRHSNSYKWDSIEREDVIPMWVADMDFKAAPCIMDALRRRVEHGVFGYTKVPDAYYEAITQWFERRHSWHIDRESVIYTSGVVPAVSAIIKALTKPGDKVILQTPAYNCFYSCIRNNGCVALANNLIYNEQDGSYTIDYDTLAAMAAEAKLLLLCNPHNPTGRVWTADELRRIADICAENDLPVLSDEIHCELTYNGQEYTPFASIAADYSFPWVVACSPSKAFNIAGLQIANIIAPDPEIRRRVDRAINDNEVCDVNPFGVAALIAAYNDGEEWLTELRRYIWDNYLTAKRFIETRLPRLKVTPLEGTYLMWINISSTGLDSDALCRILEHEGGVKLSPGSIYGPGGESFVRLNLACPRAQLDEALKRMERPAAMGCGGF